MLLLDSRSIQLVAALKILTPVTLSCASSLASKFLCDDALSITKDENGVPIKKVVKKSA